MTHLSYTCCCRESGILLCFLIMYFVQNLHIILGVILKVKDLLKVGIESEDRTLYRSLLLDVSLSLSVLLN